MCALCVYVCVRVKKRYCFDKTSLFGLNVKGLFVHCLFRN